MTHFPKYSTNERLPEGVAILMLEKGGLFVFNLK